MKKTEGMRRIGYVSLLVACAAACLCMMPTQASAISASNANFYAHRGLSAEAPDDTIAAFELAAAAGFYGIDCDLWPTAKDAAGEFDIAVSHANSLAKIAGIDRKIRDMTAEEVGSARITGGEHVDAYPDEYIPLAADFFDVASRNGLHAIVEMKGKGWTKAECRKLLSIMSDYGMLDRTIVNSLYLGNLKRFQQCALKYDAQPQTMLTILYYKNMEKRLKACADAGIPIASMRSTDIINDKTKVFKTYRKYGIGILSWTAGEKNETPAARKLIKYGIKSIVTNAKVFD